MRNAHHAQAPGAGASEQPCGNRRIGASGEDLAARYLEDLGWEIVDRNWRATGQRGEIDLVAFQPAPIAPILVAVEVKTRRSLSAGMPAEAVSREKIARLKRLAMAWASHHERRWYGMRLDVISVVLSEGQPARIRHHRGLDGGVNA